MTWPADFLRSIDTSGRVPLFNRSAGWNPWLARMLQAFLNEKYAVRQGNSVFRSIVLTGCAAASKTFSAGLFATAWWSLDPANSIAVLTSTTKDMIRNRVWRVVSHFVKTARDAETGEPVEFGRIIDSQMKVVCDDSTSTNASSISAYAVAHGETLKAIDNLKGLHAKRMLIVIDEANGTPEAIFHVLPNYRKACQDLTVVIIGNPSTRLDPHGRAATPLEGWSTFNEDLLEWRTKPVPEWQLDSGVCLRFDGKDSPNVRLKKTWFPYIYTYEDWQMAESHAGTYSWWTMTRGMWPPEGFSSTVFTEQLFTRCGGLEQAPFVFETEGETLAFLDPAFGGDACVLQFARLGNVAGRLVLQLIDWFEVPIDPNATAHDVDYQIARRVQQECVVRRVKPHCFGLDATGIGRGVGAILASEWSNQICYLNWGQAATERPSAQHDGRPAREVYDRYVTEIWFVVRELLEAGQIKGFSPEAVIQFCSRLYEMKGKKYSVEPKDEMRARIRYSPDVADAVAGVCEVARRNGLEIAGKMAVTANTALEFAQRRAHAIYETAEVHEKSGWADADGEFEQGIRSDEEFSFI